MEGSYIYTDTSSVERGIAKLYLFLLPVRMISPFLGFANLFHGAALYFDFLLNILGIAVYLVEHRFVLKISNSNSDRAFKTFGLTVCLLNLMSLVMAIITQITRGSYAGETAFSGILGMEIYFFQYVLMIAYNRRIFHVLSEDEIKRVLSGVCWCLLILGYYQILVLTFEGVFRSILNAVDVFHILWPETTMWKLSLTGKEGADAGNMFGIFVLPFLLGQLLDERKKGKALVQILLWIPPLVMMKSTSAYLMVLASAFGFLMCLYSGNARKRLFIFCGGLLIIALLLIFGDTLVNLLPTDIRYLIFGKALDFTNGSTVARLVPLVTNWNAFLQEPIIGVGNGLQGYYYIEFFPDWARNVAGSDVMTFYNTAKNEIINGGLFLPGLLSGYGIVGIGLIIHVIHSMKSRLYQMRDTSTFAYNFFRIAVPAIIVCGLQTEFSGNYLIWFVIGLPFIEYEGERE